MTVVSWGDTLAEGLGGRVRSSLGELEGDLGTVDLSVRVDLWRGA